MNSKWIKWIFVFLTVIALSACNFTLGQQNELNSADVSTIVAQNLLLTQMSNTLAARNQPQTSEAVLPTPAPATETPTLTPVPQYTPTPENVSLLVVQNSNCRSGPGNYYQVVTSFTAGSQVNVIARDRNGIYFYVQNPGSAASYCWLWKQYSTVSGNVVALPIYTGQPTATPTKTPVPVPDFTVTYDSVTSCPAQYGYALRLFVHNTGQVTWRSIKIVVVDNTTSTNFTHALDTFNSYKGCTEVAGQNDLIYSEDSFVSNVDPGQFNYDPTGHDLSVTVTLYSEDGRTGTSLSKTIQVTP